MNDPVDRPGFVASAATPRDAIARTRKPYAKPVLEPLGDIRDVTMAGSDGKGESGNAMKRKP